MTNNDFDSEIKRKLGSFEADVPDSCWDAISQRLISDTKRRQLLPWSRIAVAAILVLTVSLTGFLFVKNSSNSELIAKADKHQINRSVTKITKTDKKTSNPIDLTVKQHVRKTGKSDEYKASEVSSPVEDAALTQSTVAELETKEQKPTTIASISESTAKTDETTINPSKATDKELQAFINDGIEAQKQNQASMNIANDEKSNSLALMAGLPTMAHSSSDNEFHPLRSATAFDDAYNILTSTTISAPTTFERRHSIPFSMGILVGKEILKNTTLETGLHYTYLRSEQLQSETLNEIQKLYYLGIPVSLTYKYALYKRFSFYAKVGGMVEKNIAGRWIGEIKEGQTSEILYTKTDNSLEEKLQWSIHSGLGINYKLSKLFNFYLEPSFTYFPDNGSEYQNIRKKEKFELSLQGGIRAIFATR